MEKEVKIRKKGSSPAFLVVLTRVELAAHEVHVSLCPFLLVLSMIVLAAPDVHVPPRVRSIASTDLCKQKVGLLSTLSLNEYSW